MRIAVIDIGSNSARLDIRDLTEGGKLRIVARDKAILRLGRSVFSEGKLDFDSFNLAVDAMRGFKEQCDKLAVDRIVAVATSAIRDASNREEFVRLVQQQCGICIDVISGTREAELIARGVLRNEESRQGTFAIVDAGGGSTEITLCEKGKLTRSHSFPLGALRLREQFLNADNIAKSGGRWNCLAQLRHHVRITLSATLVLEDWPIPSTIVGTGGTAKAIARLGTPGEELRPSVERSELTSLIRTMSEMSEADIKLIPGMDEKRAEIILPGTVLLEEVLIAFTANQIHVSPFTLRDGIFDDYREETKKDQFC